MKQTVYYLHISLLLVPFISQAAITDQRPTVELPNETSTSKKPTPHLDYSDPIAFMSDFLDTSKKPEKPLKYWALQLVLLLKNDPRLIDFCHKIKNITTDRNANLDERTRSINNAFIEAYSRQLFSPELSNFIFSKTLPKVKDAIRKRAERVDVAPAA